MIQIESFGVFFTFKTVDPEQPTKPTIEGPEFSVDYFRERLPEVGGLFGNSIDLDVVSANDLFEGLTILGTMPRYTQGSGSVSPDPEPGAVF